MAPSSSRAQGPVTRARRYERVQIGQVLKKLEATVFVGNHASRRAFEKNGFTLEGTIRRAVRKRGVLVDEWLFGIVGEERCVPPSGSSA